MSKQYQVWECKVGVEGNPDLPYGADWPMRVAIRKAFKEVTGVDADFVFSGWNAPLSDLQRKVIENET